MTNYKEIDKILSRIGSKLKIPIYLHPTNLVQEKKRFFKNESYNPFFRYSQLRFKPEESRDILKKVKMKIDKSSILGKLYQQKISVWLDKIKLLETKGAAQFTKYSISTYGKPSKQLIRQVKNEIQALSSRRKSKKLRSSLVLSQVLKEFQRKIKAYNLSWKVKLKNISSRVLVQYPQTIFISRNARFTSLKEVRGTIAHEIETHVLRMENGQIQPYQIFAWGLPDYEITEEGLAVFNRDNMVSGTAFEESLRKRRALLAIGVDLALRFSFSKVYQKIRDLGANHKLAFSVTFRAKRGLADTSQPGGFTKDYIYFKGRKLVEDFVKKGGDLKSLYIGKVGIKHLALLKKIPGLKEPKYLPRFYDKGLKNS